MNQQLSNWIVIGFSILGVSAAVLAYIKTPKEKRRLKIAFGHAYSLEDRLKTYPAKAQAVIIRCNKKLALIKSIPWLLLMLLLSLVWWLTGLDMNGCARLFGVNAIQLSFLLLCYAVPVVLFIGSLYALKIGIKTLATGYFPPLDCVVFSDTIAKMGSLSLIRGLALIAIPVVAIFCLYFGNNTYQELNKTLSFAEAAKRIESKCTFIIQLP